MSEQYPYQIKENVGSTNQARNSGNTGAYQNNNQRNGNTGAYQINESGSGSYQNSGTTGYTPNSAAQNQGVPNQSSNNRLLKTIVTIVAVLVLVYIVTIVIAGIGFHQQYRENQRRAQEQYEENVRRMDQEYQERYREKTEEMRKQHEEDVQRMKDQYYGNSK